RLRATVHVRAAARVDAGGRAETSRAAGRSRPEGGRPCAAALARGRGVPGDRARGEAAARRSHRDGHARAHGLREALPGQRGRARPGHSAVSGAHRARPLTRAQISMSWAIWITGGPEASAAIARAAARELADEGEAV